MRCSVNDEDCVDGRLRRGMCERHYRRLLHRGDTANPRIDNVRHYEVRASGCWEWSGAMWGNGYGKLSVSMHGTRLAHRALYTEHRGPIPDGLDLDHLCRNRACVNPQHLEPVSRATNLERGLAARGKCRNGHDLTAVGALKSGTQQCVQCWRDRYRAAGARYRARKQETAT